MDDGNGSRRTAVFVPDERADGTGAIAFRRDETAGCRGSKARRRERYRWLDTDICSLAGEVRPRGDGVGSEMVIEVARIES